MECGDGCDGQKDSDFRPLPGQTTRAESDEGKSPNLCVKKQAELAAAVTDDQLWSPTGPLRCAEMDVFNHPVGGWRAPEVMPPAAACGRNWGELKVTDFQDRLPGACLLNLGLPGTDPLRRYE